MFKLVILILIHQSSAHTMEVTVGGFDSFDACNDKKVEVVERSRGWSDVPAPVKYPKTILSIHCKKEK